MRNEGGANMTLQQIRYVMEISRCGSISKAAQELYLTQPYLSSTLKDLENELHISIFSRSRKGITLTRDGQEFLRYAKTLLEQEERILELYTRHVRPLPFHLAVSMQRYPFVVKAFCKFFEKRGHSALICLLYRPAVYALCFQLVKSHKLAVKIIRCLL